MRYEPLGGWGHGIPANKAIALQVFDDLSETKHLNPEYFVPVHGFMVLPTIRVPHGPTLSRLYAQGISEEASCAIAAGIEALTVVPVNTGCEDCMDVTHMAGLIARMAVTHPKMIGVMKSSLFTILKHTIVEEVGLPDRAAQQDDYRSDMPLPANIVTWAQNNLTPEMMAHLIGKGLI